MSYQYILTEKVVNVGILTINQPEKRNMLHLAALKEIVHFLRSGQQISKEDKNREGNKHGF